jgi:pimeloyl-ACP methyl ester carboxylesterase
VGRVPTTVTASGVRVWFDTSGSGAPIVLLGGVAADSAFWAGLVPLLTAHRRVVTYDGRGVGRSEAPAGPYSVADLAADALGVLDAARVTEPVDLVGHSLGGAVALEVARSYPDRVRRLVLLQAPARFGGTARLALRAAGAAYDDDPRPMAAMARALFPWLFSASFLSAPGRYDELMRLSVDTATPQPRTGYEGQLAALAGFDASRWAAEVHHPALVVAADQDLLVTADDAAALARALPDATMVTVAGAGHCAPVERPDTCAMLVLGFTVGEGAR